MNRNLLLIYLIVLMGNACGDLPEPVNYETLSRGSDTETGPLILDSISHQSGNTVWRAYFHYDEAGRLELINRSGLNRWRRNFFYDGDLLTGTVLYNDDGTSSRKEFTYDAEGRVTVVAHYSDGPESRETHNSNEERTYNAQGELIESRWVAVDRSAPYINRKTYEWENGNIVKEEWYNNDRLLVFYEYEYDDNPSPGLFTHRGFYAGDLITTANNVISQKFTDVNVAIDAICNPCTQFHDYTEEGLPAYMETELGYAALYHY